MTALKEYKLYMDGLEESDPIERLRFFCSLAMKGQDWLDVERFFEDIIEERINMTPYEELKEKYNEVKERMDLVTQLLDREMVATHLGVFEDGMDPSAVLQKLFCWHFDLGMYVERTDPKSHRTFSLGQMVTKVKGSCWTGRVVGRYSTELTPEGYAVESSAEKGSVQIYPASALKSVPIDEDKEF